MSCDHLDRGGLVAHELGSRDEHVETCADCQSALAAYARLGTAIADTGASFQPRGDWQARVLAAVARDDAAPRRRWWAWLLAPAALAAAAAILLLVLRSPSRPTPPPTLALHVSVERAGAPKRALDATISDRLTVRADSADAIWIYREDRTLVAECTGPCTVDLTAPGRYQIVAVRGAPAVQPRGDLDLDLSSVTKAGGSFVREELTVR
jgi:hypothetical protein